MVPFHRPPSAEASAKRPLNVVRRRFCNKEFISVLDHPVRRLEANEQSPTRTRSIGGDGNCHDTAALVHHLFLNSSAGQPRIVPTRACHPKSAIYAQSWRRPPRKIEYVGRQALNNLFTGVKVLPGAPARNSLGQQEARRDSWDHPSWQYDITHGACTERRE